MAAIFKMADMIYTERTLFGLENVGYDVKAPNFAKRTVITYQLSKSSHGTQPKPMFLSNMAAILKMANTISTKTREFCLNILGLVWAKKLLIITVQH